MKYQQLENLESGWKWKYLVKKHREGELITRYIEASAAQAAVDDLLTLENEPVLVHAWIEQHMNPALMNRMKQTIRARRKRHFNAEHQHTRKKSIDLEFVVWQRLAGLAQRRGKTLSETIVQLIEDAEHKEKYASNPDVDTSRSALNFHLIQSEHSYREEAERQIAKAGCRVRTDSVKLVEVLIAGTPSFFKDKTQEQIKEYFEHALEFLKQKQHAETFVSAVVHLDEKTPHMHVTFVPLTEDNRLSAKEIIGNKAKLSQWQSDYWTHMVGKYPDLERGESADKTDRKHIPPRVFKEMTHLAKQSRKIEAVMDDANVFNAKGKLQEVEALLERFIPSVERMQTQLDQYKVAFTDTTAENASLKKEVLELQSKLDTAKRGSVQKKLDDAQLLNDYRELRRIVDRIPPEILERAKRQERSAAASRCTR